MRNLIKSKVVKVAFYQLAIITLIVITHFIIQSYNKREIADDVPYNAIALLIFGKFINYGLLLVFISTIVVEYFALGDFKKYWKMNLITVILSAIVYLTLLILTFKLV